ncbi:hypothetical protein [Sphingomonas sp.]|nr:hypothetical protein [Sphingomonas sp.]MBX3595412.1 hypothetical protein [Sphingomonas sp.]
MTYKGHTSFRTTLAAIACTLVVSTTCLMGAIAPGAAHAATISAQPGR